MRMLYYCLAYIFLNLEPICSDVIYGSTSLQGVACVFGILQLNCILEKLLDSASFML